MRIGRSLFDVYCTTLYIYAQVRFRSNPLFSLQGHLGRHPHQRICGLTDLTFFVYAKIAKVIIRIVGSQYTNLLSNEIVFEFYDICANGFFLPNFCFLRG